MPPAAGYCSDGCAHWSTLGKSQPGRACARRGYAFASVAASQVHAAPPPTALVTAAHRAALFSSSVPGPPSPPRPRSASIASQFALSVACGVAADALQLATGPMWQPQVERAPATPVASPMPPVPAAPTAQSLATSMRC